MRGIDAVTEQQSDGQRVVLDDCYDGPIDRQTAGHLGTACSAIIPDKDEHELIRLLRCRHGAVERIAPLDVRDSFALAYSQARLEKPCEVPASRRAYARWPRVDYVVPSKASRAVGPLAMGVRTRRAPPAARSIATLAGGLELQRAMNALRGRDIGAERNSR